MSSDALLAAVRGGSIPEVIAQILAGANPNQPASTGATVLHAAAAAGAFDIVRILLGEGADYLHKPFGKTALDYAKMGVSPQHVNTASLLASLPAQRPAMPDELAQGILKGDILYSAICIKSGLDANAPATNKATAIHSACARQHIEIVRMLLLAGADFRSAPFGKTALDYARATYNAPLIAMLDAANSGRMPDRINPAVFVSGAVSAAPAPAPPQAVALSIDDLLAAVQKNDVAGVQRCLQGGVNPSSANSQKATAIHSAAARGYADIVQLLVNAKADRNIKPFGKTALEYAKAGGHTATIAILEAADRAEGIVVLSPEYQSSLADATDAPTCERWSTPVPQGGSRYGGCELRGCTLPRQMNPLTGKWSDYCCKEHQNYDKVPKSVPWKGSCMLEGCAVPTNKDFSTDIDPCSGRALGYCCKTHQVMDAYTKQDKMLVPLQSTDHEYMSCKLQFEKAWLHQRKLPRIKAMFKINVNEAWQSDYRDYLNTVIVQNPVCFKNGGPGNEQRRFHGSMAKCSLGQQGNVTPCLDPTCPACNIIRNGFGIEIVRKLSHWARFGLGHYFTATASKSAEYPLNLPQGATRVLFMAKVVVGKGCKKLQNDVDLEAAPEGYDSVLGEVGQALNYDELVVYRDDAAILRYMLWLDE
eukprot:TRINITY_DN519_c0_g1_i1.p1 TRINITY_DN519_c0_g1~~TRINITY_DN519_c0_g1_i1.p1  ORF type:complete len:647 (+),score=165.96 TRINITY_DN519_c0_g1_i1:81-2021(+)